MGEECLQQELAKTKAELRLLRGWRFRGMYTLQGFICSVTRDQIGRYRDDYSIRIILVNN